ncbi:unnamed protein product [Ectocarpus sp. 4 AP-2014]
MLLIRRFITACTLLACWSCQRCSGFVSSPLRSALLSPVGMKQHKHDDRSIRRRGGTRMAAAPTELWDSYLHALETAPLLTKSITAGCIFPAADAVAQRFDNKGQDDEELQQQWDIARTLRWLFFGFAIQAPWNHFFYVLLDGALPPTPDPLSTTTAVKVLIDQFVQAPIFTVVIFGVLGLLEGKAVADIREQLDQDYKSTMLANWGVFVPAAVVNLAFCPPELRVLFLNVVFFGWTIFLSTVVSKGPGEAVEEA